MVRDHKQPLVFDPCENIVCLPGEGLDANVPLLDVLPSSARHFYMGHDVLHGAGAEELASASKRLMAKKGSYAKFIAKLEQPGIVERIPKMSKVINEFFCVPKMYVGSG